jgi:hypothetical protein
MSMGERTDTGPTLVYVHACLSPTVRVHGNVSIATRANRTFNIGLFEPTRLTFTLTTHLSSTLNHHSLDDQPSSTRLQCLEFNKPPTPRK